MKKLGLLKGVAFMLCTVLLITTVPYTVKAVDSSVVSDIVSYIYSNGTRSGNNFTIKTTRSNGFVYAITYQPDKEVLYFASNQTVDDNQWYTASMDYDINKKNVSVVNAGYYGFFGGTNIVNIYSSSGINMKTYRFGDIFDFVIDTANSKNSDQVEDSFFQTNANTTAKNAFYNWDDLLKEKTGYRLKDIGFVNFDGTGSQTEDKPGTSEKTSGSEHFTNTQSGSQKGTIDNFKNPLSAWKKTEMVRKANEKYYTYNYAIRLEEMYIGEAANSLLQKENKFNTKPTNSQQWILMNFYLENLGSTEFKASDIINYAGKYFYTSSGASMTIIDDAVISGRNGFVNIYDLSLVGGASGYFSMGILVDKTQGLPYLKLKNGVSDDGINPSYCWLNTDPDYTYNYVEKRVTGISLDKTTLSLVTGDIDTMGQYGSLVATVFPEDALNKDITWVSNNPSVATVNDKGEIRAVSAGTAVIEAITDDGGFKSSCKVSVVGAVTMFRLYNPNSGEHFYTSNEAERDNLKNKQWQYEGTAWTAPSISNSPVYRLYNPIAGDHHYTTDQNEVRMLISVGWKDEGIAWYSNDDKRVSLYRLYNPNAVGAGSHHYTLSYPERYSLINSGWKDEGIGWYGL